MSDEDRPTEPGTIDRPTQPSQPITPDPLDMSDPLELLDEAESFLTSAQLAIRQLQQRNNHLEKQVAELEALVQVAGRTGNNKPEPPPNLLPRTPAVWDLFMGDHDRGGANWLGLVDDITERDRAGELKYGTRLRLNNGRDPRVDAYQELLDAMAYTTQWRHEVGRSSFINHSVVTPIIGLALLLREDIAHNPFKGQ